MAVDTRNKRASALGLGLAPLAVLPAPDSTVGAPDRPQLAYSYAGTDFTGVAGVGAVELNAFATSAAGTYGPTATADAELNAFSAAGTGAVEVVGAGAVELNGFAASAEGIGGEAVEPDAQQPVGAGGGEPYRTGGISGEAFIDRRGEPRQRPTPTPPAPEKAREPASAPAAPGRSLSELLPRDQSRRQARADVRRERGPATPDQDEQARREAQAATDRLIAWLESSIAENEAIALDDAEVLSFYRNHRTGLVLRYLRAAGRHDVAASIQAALDTQSREAA